MALQANSSYVVCLPSDVDFCALLQTFYGKVDVSNEAENLIQYGKRNASTLSGRFTVGTYSANTWYRVANDRLTAWGDAEGWARHLLGSYIVGNGLLDHMFYPIDSEIRSALATPRDILIDKLSRVGKTIFETSPYQYKVSKAVSKTLASTYGDGSTYYADLIFSVGNYLGRVPTREEILGDTALPVAAFRPGTLVVDAGSDVTSNEIKLAIPNLRGKNLEADAVEGVYFKTRAAEISAVAELLFERNVLDICSNFPAVKLVILNRLKEIRNDYETFEERVETQTVIAAQSRADLQGLLLFKDEVPLNVALATMSTLKGEIFRGDAATVQSRHEDNLVARTLRRVGSQFTKSFYSELTRRLVSALLTANPKPKFSYVEAIFCILQRYIHYRTNALRYVNLPAKLEYMYKRQMYIIDFSTVDGVFATMQNAIPEIERAWCAPLANASYFLLKDTGGSFAKWKDLPDIPPSLNFDFVGFVDPRILSATEQISLSKVVHRFRTHETPVRGFKLGSRSMNPVDNLLDNTSFANSEKRALSKIVNSTLYKTR
uniref:61.1 kDa protein n=1 Tax=Ginger chlorotic fleck-associated virus TaxID=2739639 RepID=A0A6M8ELZ7_9CLOS|nr:61.1 kDa protein [Ginger chlorotic fleck-associated virus]